MNLVKNLRWAVIATSILSGSALAAIDCVITPNYSIITEGQTLQLAAKCNGDLDTVNWKMDGVSVTGDVTLTAHTAADSIYYTTPVGLGGSNTFGFTMTGSGTAGAASSNSATVVVKPSSAAVAQAQGVSNPTTPVAGQCGTASGGSAQAMPTGTAQCAFGTAALAVSGPSSFTWSCVSSNGGAEDSCYALRGFTVTATEGTNPTHGSVSPSSQGVASGATASFNGTVDAGYSVSFTSTCGGSQSGNNFTTGAVNANCTVTANYTNAPVNGACGSASNSTVVTSAPSSNLCSTGSATAVASGASSYTWGCNGSNGGSSTSATACSAPRGYTVTVSSGGNGTVSGSPKTVQGGTSTSFSVSPAGGYVASSVTGSCGGSVSGSTYNTGSITADCSETVNFTQQSASTDPGSGYWNPPGMTNRLIADQSGTSDSVRITYAPGCLNGDYSSSSNSGCAGQSVDETGFAFGSGNVLGIRYTSKSPVSTSAKYFRITTGDGGTLGYEMKAWLSTDPLSTYDNTASTCRWTSTTNLYAVTGSGYCVTQPNTRYYLFMSVDGAYTNLRYKVDELSADFN
jgi:hypothetical protein